MLLLTIAQLDITLEFIFFIFYFFYFSLYFCYTSAFNLVSMFVRVIAIKANVCVCEDEVKLNYSHSILSQREPSTAYVENKEKHTKEI